MHLRNYGFEQREKTTDTNLSFNNRTATASFRKKEKNLIKTGFLLRFFVSLIFLLSIISEAMSTESFLNSYRVIIRGEQGVLQRNIKPPFSRQGRGLEKKRPGNAGPFLRFSTIVFITSPFP